MYELCRNLLASGRRCTQPAVTGTPYCRHHRVVKRTVAESVLPHKFRGLHRALPFLYPEDRAAIQANCFLVMRALDDLRIDTQTANAMNRLLRTCEMNLKRGPLHESDSKVDKQKSSALPASSAVNPSPDAGPLKPALSGEQNDAAIVRHVILTPAGEEIAPPCEVWDESEQQHHNEECPCRLCAEQYRGAAPEQHHADCRCGACPHQSGAGAPEPAETWEENSNPSSDNVPPKPNLSGEQKPDYDWKQESERRKQIYEKHKDRFVEIERQYQHSPELAKRITAAFQEVMELEVGHEAFSYPLHQHAAF